MNFYHYRQNNSGGAFIVSETLCHHLFIEADNEHIANEKAVSLGVYFDGCENGMDCQCCGDRWYTPDLINLQILSTAYKINFATIEDFAQYYANEHKWTTPEARVFYANGTISEFNKITTRHEQSTI
jgi:hypothetical protein